MNFRQYLKSLESFFDEPEPTTEIPESSDDIMCGELFSWLFDNVMPALSLTLVINLIITFTVPVEMTMYRWFWLKDPVSLGIGFILVKCNEILSGRD